ncbi:MAG: winged helix-turn-helix domain-containing protein [Paludibacter sp.]|nr:winged helix-turn-helix domain-containing protein [Paludibacter sp.]
MLSGKIGTNAGLVYAALQNGEMNVKAVKKATKLAEKDLNLALGWLAREGKIKFNEVEADLFVSLS